MPVPVAIDIYHGDSVNSFQAVKDSGIVAVIHKASEGHNIDRSYAPRRHAFLDVGMKWGSYHFFHGGGKSEADFFLSVCEPDENTVVALDWETTAGGYTPDADAARAFLERIEEKLGRKAVIYSGDVAKEQISGHDAYFGSHRLWLAQYASHWSVQHSWDKPWLWQYGSEITHSRIPGISGYCDVNTLVDMSVDDFVSTWTEAVSPPVPSPSGFVQSGEASWYDDSANASGTPVDNDHDMTAAHKTLPFGTVVEVSRHDINAAVVVTIQDRGPYEPGRIIDLRPAAARALGMIDAGVVPVTIKQLTP